MTAFSSTGRREHIFRHALAVAQNHETVGDVQQFLEKVTDINDADSGIAQTSDDVVQPLDLGDMQ